MALRLALMPGWPSRLWVSDVRLPIGRGGIFIYLWKLPEPIIFFFERARKTPDMTSNVGSS